MHLSVCAFVFVCLRPFASVFACQNENCKVEIVQMQEREGEEEQMSCKRK